MACSLKTSFYISGSNETMIRSKTKGVIGFCSSVAESKSRFMGNNLNLVDQKGFREWTPKHPNKFSLQAQSSICVSKAMRWWEKCLKPNMVEIQSAQELVESLSNAGDKLVIVDFYSPGCGGCKALHPKICQLAESNPNAIFLQVNYEELKAVCHTLNIHVLPFFRFYRGSEGRLCSFSCTNATIKKFKDALAKHGTNRCDLGPAKGLDESELLSLASIGELSLYSPLPSFTKEDRMENLALKGGRAKETKEDFEAKEEEAILVA